MYSIYALVVFVSEILTRQQIVRKYRTPALSMKYSLYIYIYKQKSIVFRVFKMTVIDSKITLLHQCLTSTLELGLRMRSL